MDTSALVPDMEPLIPEDVEETQQAQQEQLVSGDRELADLQSHAGYRKLEERLDAYIDDFTTGKSMAFDKDTPLDVIGQKYVVASTIASICAELKGMVTSATEAVNQEEMAKREAEGR